MNRLHERYLNEIQPALIEKFNYSTPMMCPKMVKIVVNMGVGDAIANSKLLDDANGRSKSKCIISKNRS